MKIGIDLGGTKTEAVLLDQDNQQIKKIRRSTPLSQGYDAILRNIKEIVDELVTRAGTEYTIGIGTPGSIDKNTQLLKYSNSVCLNHKPIRDDLENLLGQPIRIENDANCFALSEAIDGSGRTCKSVFGIIMGTGVGGGIVIDKTIINGPNGMTGEWGHTVLDASGHDCYCGLKGCIETYLSGPGLIRHHVQNGGKPVQRVEQLLEQAEVDDPVAVKSLDNYYSYFARAISQIIKFLDPDVIVLGGGLSNVDTLYNKAADRINDYFYHPVSINLKRNTHGDSSGVRGAACLWDHR